MTELKEYLKKVVDLTDSTLEKLLPNEKAEPNSIHTLMRYVIFAGGKRVRPCLVLATHEACGGDFANKDAAYAGAAIEMLHTFSLIHDDLPCMDDDDFRRGKPTAHKAFNEALAVLGGDALCIFAFEILSKIGRIEIINEISSALGTYGMIGGQVVDIESEGKPVSKETVKYIHKNKTAALIEASVKTGALLANAPAEVIKKLSSYGSHIGLLFQVIDDILDEESTTETLGKDAGSDRARGKATFPSVYGIEESKKYAKRLLKEAQEDIKFLGDRGNILNMLAEYILIRVS